MAKTGSVIYGVIADTHGYPWGRRERITSGQYAEKYLFDLGDNTMCTTIGGEEPVEVISGANIRLFGNHDTCQNNYQLKGLQILEDTANKVIIFGLDSCTSNLTTHTLISSQVTSLANRLEQLDADWDVIVLTHVPLFPATDATGYCWSEERPTYAGDLIKVLSAYKTHSICECLGSTFDYTSKTGNVIGCFCGHVHNSITCAINGIYMEAFTTNGAETYLPSTTNNTRSYNSGLYSPNTTRISIDFDHQTVNNMSYINPTSDYHIGYSAHPENDKGQQAHGAFVLRSGGTDFPKFMTDGTYVGWGSTAFGAATENSFSAWSIDSSTITIGNSSVNATQVLWGCKGLLRYYVTASGSRVEIPNYENTTVRFVSNGMQWNFSDGKYLHDRGKMYKFKASSSAYPVFDSRGYYLGWSNAANGYITGLRDSGTSSRTWELVDSGTTRVYQNGVHVAAAVQVRFDTDGRLSGFIRSTGTIYSDVSGTIEFMTNGVKWTFYNRLFQSAVSGDSIEVNYTASDQWMDYTTTAYYMTYENGYLMHYRYTSDAAGTQRTNIATSWASNRTVKFYTNATNAYRNVSAVSQKSLTSITFAGNVSNGFYITEGSFSASYNYARIDTASDTYYFKHVGSQWIMIDIYRG